MNSISRRSLLTGSLQLTLLGTVGVIAAGCQKTPAVVCANPDSLRDAEMSLRQSLHYTELSPRSEQVCARCGFFEASAGACGTCKLLKGPVNPKGHCDSWNAAKS
jgi:hypothetical protein